MFSYENYMESKIKKKRFRFTQEKLHPKTASTEDVYQLQALLSSYGYLTGSFQPGKYDEATCHAVSQFQTFYNIYPEEDGVCDKETIDLLNQPRCGVCDPAAGQRSIDGRLASFVTVAKWSTTQLTFKFLNSTPDLAEDRQRDIIREAFSRWSNVSSLEFKEVELDESSLLSVAFHRGSHGDGSPFDDQGGPDGNTLAHGFFPPPRGGTWAGSLHFDEFEAWKDQAGGQEGIRLYNVALHEIGHCLGLSHSQDKNAIMYAYYGEDRNDLRADDIAGIQSLYGSSVSAPVVISPGEKINDRLQQTNSEVHYQVTLQNKLLIKLDGPQGEDFDLYVRHGEPVGREPGQHDMVSYGFTADELITIENPKAGTYYILVHSYRGKGSYNLQVEVV